MVTILAGSGGAGGRGHLTAWRVASATCPTRAGSNEKHSVRIVDASWMPLTSLVKRIY